MMHVFQAGSIGCFTVLDAVPFPDVLIHGSGRWIHFQAGRARVRGRLETVGAGFVGESRGQRFLAPGESAESRPG